MIAGVLYFTGTSPLHEGEEYAGPTLDRASFVLGAIAAACVAPIWCSRYAIEIGFIRANDGW